MKFKLLQHWVSLKLSISLDNPVDSGSLTTEPLLGNWCFQKIEREEERKIVSYRAQIAGLGLGDLHTHPGFASSSLGPNFLLCKMKAGITFGFSN